MLLKVPAAYRWLLVISLIQGAGIVVLSAADLPPDKDGEVPATAKRPVLIQRKDSVPAAPEHTLPTGWSLTQVAGAPLVTHPIMGCVDDRGRLFIGDAVGVNWNKEQLEKNPPNRILLLEDEDGDGVYDRSTVFADKMTFPQGAAWLDGSLYVCSPPGLWKLTDTNNDGVADERKMIVKGFDYTGNAADVHGPKLHPDGRLYWCHGRKGHAVTGSDGVFVQSSKASGIWSCKPDGSNVQWHSLGCADNPTGLAFTPRGDILGTCNLYYSQPRGDTLMHWLYGGVYERADQMQVISAFPRTLARMPVIHNFGHVAVSGCAFGQGTDALSLYVTHFNTQRLVRMELEEAGATFKAVENEFLKIHNPDVHLTDVMVDKDGSLLVLNTGGWFRIGCPSSLMAKPDLLGSIYRLRGPKPDSTVSKPEWSPWWKLEDKNQLMQQLRPSEPRAFLHALTAVAKQEPERQLATALKAFLEQPMEPVLEHAYLQALRASNLYAVTLDDIRQTHNVTALRRMLISFVPDDSASMNMHLGLAAKHLDSADNALASIALDLVVRHPDADEWVTPDLDAWLDVPLISPERTKALEGYANALHAKPKTQALLGRMLRSSESAVRNAALRILAGQPGVQVREDWLPVLEPKADDPNLPLILTVLKRLKKHPYDEALQSFANDSALPLTLRLKALDAQKKGGLGEESFALLTGVLADASASSAARIQAASMLGAAQLSVPQLQAVAPAFATAGPVEMEKLLPTVRRLKDEKAALVLAGHLAKNPALLSQQESVFRTVFSHLPPEIFEKQILPARQKLEQQMDAKKRELGNLADKAARSGNVEEGRKHFASGKGTCIACHKIGETGRAIGPDLSRIGAIRTERDLMESILFPSNTLARDYEAHVFELRDGQTALGVIRSHVAEGLLLLDIAGQERLLPHDQIVSDTTLTTSLMPMGLDATLTGQELLDLVAYLRSLQ